MLVEIETDKATMQNKLRGGRPQNKSRRGFEIVAIGRPIAVGATSEACLRPQLPRLILRGPPLCRQPLAQLLLPDPAEQNSTIPIEPARSGPTDAELHVGLFSNFSRTSLARSLAKRNNIDLYSITGRGPVGTDHPADVEAAIARLVPPKCVVGEP